MKNYKLENGNTYTITSRDKGIYTYADGSVKYIAKGHSAADADNCLEIFYQNEDDMQNDKIDCWGLTKVENKSMKKMLGL